MKNKFEFYGKICKMIRDVKYPHYNAVKEYVKLAIKRGYLDKVFIEIMTGTEYNKNYIDLYATPIVYYKKSNEQLEYMNKMIDISDRIRRCKVFDE
jgi:hypothetical protein